MFSCYVKLDWIFYAASLILKDNLSFYLMSYFVNLKLLGVIESAFLISFSKNMVPTFQKF